MAYRIFIILKQFNSCCIYEISYLKVGKMSSKFLYSTAPSTNTVDSSSSEKSKEKDLKNSRSQAFISTKTSEYNLSLQYYFYFRLTIIIFNYLIHVCQVHIKRFKQPKFTFSKNPSLYADIHSSLFTFIIKYSQRMSVE